MVISEGGGGRGGERGKVGGSFGMMCLLLGRLDWWGGGEFGLVKLLGKNGGGGMLAKVGDLGLDGGCLKGRFALTLTGFSNGVLWWGRFDSLLVFLSLWVWEVILGGVNTSSTSLPFKYVSELMFKVEVISEVGRTLESLLTVEL